MNVDARKTERICDCMISRYLEYTHFDRAKYANEAEELNFFREIAGSHIKL